MIESSHLSLSPSSLAFSFLGEHSSYSHLCHWLLVLPLLQLSGVGVKSFHFVVMRLVSPLMTASSSSSIGIPTTTAATTAMIILNSPITRPPSMVFDRLWKSSQYHICADGGANRLMDSTREYNDPPTITPLNDNIINNNDNNMRYIPNCIRGDLDSLRDDTRAYFESLGVEIEQDPDQDSNDLTKALHKVMTISPPTFEQIIIYGAFGGRFDQEMASFQTLYSWAPTFQHRIWLYSDATSACLIPPNGPVEIQIPHSISSSDDGDDKNVKIREGPTCGLIPLGCSCTTLRTTGFKWNLNGEESSFGGLVSTSNHIIDEVITVEASHPIVFTAEVVVVPLPNTVK